MRPTFPLTRHGALSSLLLISSPHPPPQLLLHTRNCNNTIPSGFVCDFSHSSFFLLPSSCSSSFRFSTTFGIYLLHTTLFHSHARTSCSSSLPLKIGITPEIPDT
ncbi:uncharacterized protein LY89DRAFT_235296 [Mollisia scopiformis]|uniref:Uncharacterized protein n=1 Tax=Mollisia scopiformis TaxID=149040 RepID=A0A194WTL7_MOLSC|nr:uncharacterized protein LY89DRAFT_235296 [Mollisia scopiformis]KUJ11024.1 hypothetical protein LY89DRAFT_235296 [Mollisia scopiformis]